MNRPTTRAHGGLMAAMSWNWRVVLLVILLPLFGQSFHYIKDLKPLWALSKAFPILSLPLILPVLTRRSTPLLFDWLLALLWLVLTSSIIAMFTFEQNFILGLSAQVKLLPMLYALSFLGLLLLVRPTPDELLFAFACCAVLTFTILFLLWALAPQSWYATGYEMGDAPLLSADDRGNRIRMPMYFGMIALFSLNRRLLARPDWRTALFMLVALALIVGVVRTRSVVLASMATLGLVIFMEAPPRWRVGALVAAVLGGLVLLQVPYVQSAFDTSAASGFNIREVTAAKSIAFLGQNPLLWLLGAGTITSLDPGGLAKYFNHFFFLADITWLGVVFEFGLLGAGVFLFLLARTWFFGRGLRRSMDSPGLGGLQDYVLFTIVQSPLYSTMTLQPGEIAVIAASFVYCALLLRDRRVDEAVSA